MKLIKTILIFSLSFTCLMPISAKANDNEFYAYTTTSSEHDNYIMMNGTRVENGTTLEHAMAIIGYTNISGEILYTVWDPHDANGKDALITMSASTRLVTLSNSKTFTWNGGYIYNFDK